MRRAVPGEATVDPFLHYGRLLLRSEISVSVHSVSRFREVLSSRVEASRGPPGEPPKGGTTNSPIAPATSPPHRTPPAAGRCGGRWRAARPVASGPTAAP